MSGTNGHSAQIEGFNGVEETDSGAYLSNYQAHKTGISHDEMVTVYSQWAANYDKDLCPGRYNGPEIAAKAVLEYYLAKKKIGEEAIPKVKVLDVAAGTGRVGEELSKVGFRNIDALEPSDGMLKLLRERFIDGDKVYDTTYECFIGEPFSKDVPSNFYDCLVIAGGMGEGHIPVSAIDEMVRVVKPGGTVFIVMREEYLTYVKEYVDRLEPYMEELEKKEKWKKIARDIVAHYSFNKNGVVYSYLVTDPAN